MLSALLLFLYNGYEERRAGQEAEVLLDDVRAAIDAQIEMAVLATEEGNNFAENPGEHLPVESSSVDSLSEETISEEQGQTSGNSGGSTNGSSGASSVVTIGEYGYIGYISIPDIGMELPIISEWNYDRLKIAPCRHFGSTETDDLVIAGHNYKTHFGPIGRLPIGTEIQVTDMDGTVHYYKVEDKTTLPPESVEEVQNSGYDLVLYTCKLGGENRIVVFCDRVMKETGIEE